MRNRYRDGTDMPLVSLAQLVNTTKDVKHPPGISYILSRMCVPADDAIDTDDIAFNSLPVADEIIDWSQRHGFDDRLCDMLTMQAIMDYRQYQGMVLWSITLPDQETFMLFRLGVDLNKGD